MLLESVKRYDGKGLVHLYNLDVHQRPAQITSVPSMLLMPSKQVLLGKAVFDYLLLPSRGVLVNGGIMPAADEHAASSSAVPQQQVEPIGFQLDGAMTTQSFSFVPSNEQPHEDALVDDRALTWGSYEGFKGNTPSSGGVDNFVIQNAVQQTPTRPAGAAPLPFAVNADTRDRKGLPDMEAIKLARENDLRKMGIN
jgi:hypothetical protein